MAGTPKVYSRHGKMRRADGRLVTHVNRHWRDYPAPNPQPTPCKIWSGVLDKDGYGVLGKRSGDGSRRKIQAHRWIWEGRYGPIPKGMVVRHKCDNPPCINLQHLELGTVADNNNDARERGHLGPAWKLTPSQMREFFDRHEAGESIRSLARHFGVSDGTLRGYLKRGRDGFPHVWGERIPQVKQPKPLKHSSWRDRNGS